MKKINIEAKTYEEAVKQACEKLNASEIELFINELENKKGLFSKKTVIEAVTKEELSKEIKNIICQIVKGITDKINIEQKNRDDVPTFNIITDASVLIGRNGRTIDAIQTLVKATLNEQINGYYRINIDVNDYKLKRQGKLEKLAKYTAKEVAKTKIEAKLDPMNSYERRIIHNALTNSKDVKTESVGEEPERCVVIKPKEE